jgi:hypothetical protein
MLKYSLNFGAIIGLLLIAVSLLSSALNMEQAGVFDMLAYLILIGGMVYSMRNYRDNVLGGFITFEKSLGLGTTIGIGVAVIVSFFTYIYTTFFDSELIELLQQTLRDQILSDESWTTEQKEQQLNNLEKAVVPSSISLLGFMGFSFFGFLFSLVISLFLRKNKPFLEGADEHDE